MCDQGECRLGDGLGGVDNGLRALYFSDQLISQQVNSMTPSERLDATFFALSDPTRRAILARLSQGEVTVKKLAEPLPLSLPAISKHLKVLEQAGLIERGRDAQWRPCRLQVEPLKEISDWLDDYRRMWDESFDRLDDYLRELQSGDES
jgi:DNA-binding transcriptional ArsR family regulator